jgi:DNA replication protein DnaC
MHKKVIHHLQKLKVEIVQTCPQCKGLTCNYCSAKYDFYEQVAHAGIPIKYWDLELSDLDPKAQGVSEVKSYLSKLKEAYEGGKGIFAYGKNGNGKTLCACVIGKEAIKRNYTVRYTFLGEVISAFVDTMYDQSAREQLKEDILGVDFLILDDVDKTYKSENSKYVDSILDTLFRTRVQNNLPVIMTSNKTIGDILTSSEEVFSKSLLSLFDESLLPILFMGADKRAELKKDAIKKFLTDNEASS